MRSGEFGKVAERWGSLSPEASRRHSGWQTRAEPAADLGRLLEDCARRLPTWDVRDPDGALTLAIDVLAQGLMADRISFFMAAGPAEGKQCDRFDSIREWPRQAARRLGSRDSMSTGSSVHLESLPEHGAKLRSGRALEIEAGVASSKALGSASTRWMTSWSRSRSVLYLPCLGPMGLLGFFAVESAVRVDGRPESTLRQATLVSALFAGFLERERSSAELEGIRRQMSRGEQLETLGLVASSAAHDFNNVLTAILGYADLAGMEIAEGGPGQSEIAEIRVAATRAAELVKEVLAPNRKLAGGTVSVNLSEVVGSLEGMLRRIVGKSVEVEIDFSDRAERVRVDPSRLERALFNLAANAREALAKSPDTGGLFELSTRSVEIDAVGRDRTVAPNLSIATPSNLKPGRYVRLSVSDNGSGIDREIQSKIFEPFFTTRAKGTGLGLASVAEFMAETTGAIRLESAPGRGTTLHLYFPVDDINTVDTAETIASVNPTKAVDPGRTDDPTGPV